MIICITWLLLHYNQLVKDCEEITRYTCIILSLWRCFCFQSLQDYMQIYAVKFYTKLDILNNEIHKLPEYNSRNLGQEAKGNHGFFKYPSMLPIFKCLLIIIFQFHYFNMHHICLIILFILDDVNKLC